MQLVTKAKKGDSQAARLLMERVLPQMKPIAQADKQCRPVNMIQFVRAENAFPGFTGLSPNYN